MAHDLSQVLKKGTLLIIETGEYSGNYGGPVKLLRSFTKQELADAYLVEWKKEDYPDNYRDEPNPDSFLSWLIKSKRAVAVDNVHSWHVGSYSEFTP